jgi:hypothetical protein
MDAIRKPDAPQLPLTATMEMPAPPMDAILKRAAPQLL